MADTRWYSTTGATTAITSTNDIFYGHTEMSDPTTNELRTKVKQLEDLFFREVVVKCSWCGSWGAAMTQCKHCGSPIDLGNDIRE